jgi:hypothetical protein
MKRWELKQMIKEETKKLKETEVGYDASGHVKDLGWYLKSLDKFQKDVKISEKDNSHNDEVTMIVLKKIKKDWEKITKESIDVEKIKKTIYAFGSELATLRLLSKYTAKGQISNKKINVGYSSNLKKYFFSLEKQ